MKSRDITVDMKFGMLTVESAIQEKNGSSFLCRCDCGKIVKKSGSLLLNGKSSSPLNCGCAANRLTHRGYDRARSMLYKTYGYLKVIALSDEIDKFGFSRLICQCECGTKIVKERAFLEYKKNRNPRYPVSCGCKTKAFSMESSKRLKNILYNMEKRCYDKTHKSYALYGAKGVTVCAEWVENPDNFIEWALENGYENRLTIDRINGNKGYCPENCRWISKSNQAYNKSTTFKVKWNGEYIPASLLAKGLNIAYPRIYEAWKKDHSIAENFNPDMFRG